MKRIKKIIGSVMGSAIIMFSVSMPVLASELAPQDYTEKGEESVAELDPSLIGKRGLFDDYNVYSSSEWIFDANRIAVGATGWTDLDYKSDGSNKYHYSNMQVYYGTQTWSSGRNWGYGRVPASVKAGQIVSSKKLYYGY